MEYDEGEEAADGRCAAVLSAGRRCPNAALEGSRYRLMAKWETLENHTVDFRGSEDFTAWRALVGQYFAAPPEVEHTETVVIT